MLYDYRMTAKQAHALGQWVVPTAADVLVRREPDDRIYVGQGDARAYVHADGRVEEVD